MEQEEAKREQERKEAQKRSNIFLYHSPSSWEVRHSWCLLILPKSNLQKWSSWSQHIWICGPADLEISEKNETARK